MIVDFTAFAASRSVNVCLCKECRCQAYTYELTQCRKCERGAHLPDFPCTVSPIAAEADIAV